MNGHYLSNNSGLAPQNITRCYQEAYIRAYLVPDTLSSG